MRGQRRWPLAGPVESRSQASDQVRGARFTPTLLITQEGKR